MRLNHLALVFSSEEKSDRFFIELLGLAKLRSRLLTLDFGRRLFNLDREVKFVDYGREDLRFEVFIDPESGSRPDPLAHVCLEVNDRPSFLGRAEAMGLKVTQAAKGEAVVVFIEDSDGHFYEIKERA
ncbi:MAG: hypothetical protein AB1641_18555 [Thermodesulfobacteriota bacterium]